MGIKVRLNHKNFELDSKMLVGIIMVLMLTKINSGLAPTIGARHGIYVPSIQNADLNRADEDHPINQPDTENEPNSGNQQNATNQTNQENQKYLDLWEPCILDNTTYIGAYLVPEACDVESWHNCALYCSHASQCLGWRWHKFEQLCWVFTHPIGTLTVESDDMLAQKSCIAQNLLNKCEQDKKCTSGETCETNAELNGVKCKKSPDQCTADTACTSVKGKPKCDTGSTPKACVQCLANTDCVSVTGKPKCDISNKECVAADKPALETDTESPGPQVSAPSSPQSAYL